MKANKRILLLSPLPPPVGGIASWSVNLLSYLKRRNYEINHLNTAMKLRSVTSKNKYLRGVTGVLDFIRLFFSFCYKLITVAPYYIYITNSGSWGLYKAYFIILLARSLNCKLTIHFRFGRIPNVIAEKKWEYRILRKVINKSHSVIVLDQASLDAISEDQTITTKTYIVPNPVSVEVEKIALQKRNEYSDTYLFVGHVTKSKGIFELLHAFKEVTLPITIDIIGPYESDVQKEIEQYLKRHQLGGRVKLLGQKDKSEVLKAMLSAKALILPSYTEGFPNVVIEAMACGCPVLATPVGAIKEMISFTDYKNLSNAAGVCFEAQSTNALVEALLFIENNLELLSVFSKNGKNKILEYYTLDKVVPQYGSIVYNKNVTIKK